MAKVSEIAEGSSKAGQMNREQSCGRRSLAAILYVLVGIRILVCAA